MFLFFAKVDESRESLQVMCESLAWLSMALLVGFSYTNSFLKAPPGAFPLRFAAGLGF